MATVGTKRAPMDAASSRLDAKRATVDAATSRFNSKGAPMDAASSSRLGAKRTAVARTAQLATTRMDGATFHFAPTDGAIYT